MTKPTHIEFLESSQFSICQDKSKDGLVNLHVKCQLSSRQSEIVKDALRNYDVVLVNQTEIILPPAKEVTVYKNVKVIDGVAFLDGGNIELN